ncbi:MAG: DUF2500 domain-containing protein [Oscillospiraceae bacterium]|nr:DUF2500 domain-containing protein [Oscillospiraceae bacterium]
MGFGLGFGLFQIMFTLVFLAVMCMFVFVAVKGIAEWNKNNNSPRLTVDATVVSKRTNISHSHHHHGTGHVGHSSTSTTYYVTFQVASGDRLELRLAGHQFGLMVEGDRGRLTFQGTRFLDFQRT